MMPLQIRCIFRNIWSRITLRHTIAVIACYWAMSVQISYRAHGRFLFLLLPWVGSALTALSLLLLISHLLAQAESDAPFLQTLRFVEKGSAWLVRIFVYYSLLLYANAKLDQSPPVDRPATIMAISGIDVDLDLPMSYSWARLRFAADPEETDRLLLNRKEARKLWGGEGVVLETHRGRFGLSWISKVQRDEEKHSREVLALAPTAAEAWKNLIRFYLDHERWKEASVAAQQYLKIYPTDDPFALSVAGALNVSGHYADGIAILDPIVEKRPTYEAYQLLGWALSFNGERPRAAEVLEASIPLNPEDWEAYYHLGYVYNDMGKVPEAIANFEKVLERRPHFPEVKKQLADLRHLAKLQEKLAARRAASPSPSPEEPAAAP
jgi:tetratricopeptide (TPR) repeat protein